MVNRDGVWPVLVMLLILLLSAPATATPDSALSGQNNSVAAIIEPTKTESIFSIQYQIEKKLITNESSTLTVKIRAKKTVRNVSISIIEPFGFETTPNSMSVGSLSSNETVSFDLTVTPRYPLTRNLRVNIVGDTTEGSFERYSVYRLTSQSGIVSAQSTTVPVQRNHTGIGTQLIGGQSDNQDQIRTTNSDCTKVKITGKGEYTYNGKTYPMDNVTVEVWDYDVNSENDFVSSQSATQDGSFSFCVADTDFDEGRDFDPFVSIYAENPAAIAQTEQGGSIYYASTAWYEDISNGETLNLGTDSDDDGQLELIPTSNNPAWQAVDWSLDEYQVISDSTDDDWNRSQLNIYWPSGNWPAYSPQYTLLGELDGSSDYMVLPNKEQYLDWGSRTIYHEYGHAVMFSAYDNSDNIPSYGNYSCHNILSETDPGFALIEGWAEFMNAVVSGSPDAVTAVGQNIETNTWYNYTLTDTQCPPSDAGQMDGYRVEGSAASIWFDIIDSGFANDESMDHDFQTVFEIIHEQHPQNSTHFYDLWTAGNREELDQIYLRYGIDTEPPQIETSTNNTVFSQSSVTLAGTVSDEHSNVSSVKIRVNDGDWQRIDHSNRNWSFRSNLSDGDHTAIVQATDPFDNANTRTISFKVNTTDNESSGNTPLNLTINTETASPNETTSVTFTVSNTGDSALSGVAINITQLPNGWVISSRDDSSGTWSDDTNTWLWLSLEASQSQNPSVTLSVPNTTSYGEYQIKAKASDANNHRVYETTNISITAGTQSIERAIAGDDNRIGIVEIQQAIRYWANGETVPNTGEKTIGLVKIQKLVRLWANNETVN